VNLRAILQAVCILILANVVRASPSLSGSSQQRCRYQSYHLHQYISLTGNMISITSRASVIQQPQPSLLAAPSSPYLTTKKTLSLAPSRPSIKPASVASTIAISPPGRILAMVTDTRQPLHVDSWVSRSTSHFGRLDGSAACMV